jgi:predicted Zn-dependent protease
MLAKLDRDLIFKRIKELGYSSAQLYAERATTTQVEIQDKDQKARHFESGGISIELTQMTTGTLSTFRTNQFSTEAVLALLEPRNITIGSYKASPSSPGSHYSLGKKLQSLQFLVRKINLENALVTPVHFFYQEKRQRFECCNESLEISTGEIETGEVKLDIKSCYRGQNLNFCLQISSSSLEGLAQQLNKLPEEIQRRIRLGSTERWPLPEGKLQVAWSSKALAKMLACFIRGFEGDLFLKNFSFLSKAALPLPFQFSIYESPDGNHLGVDHEGRNRKPLIVFDGKRPRALALDSLTADELSVESTGHSRRESFESIPSIGFWHPHLKGHSEVDSILGMMSQGIWVEDLEIDEWDLISGLVSLHFSQTNLVHQGQLGESLEPFAWTLSLTDLLSSMTHFSTQTATCGLFHCKQKQKIFTEYTTPMALSNALKLPGSVPASHYWE